VGHLSGGMVDTNYQFVYQYDAMGNTTQAVRNADTTVYAVNNLNQYTMSSNVNGTATGHYFDDNGNTINDGTSQFAWDQDNHHVEVSNGVQRMEYQVNGLHRRVERRAFQNDVLQTTTRVVYDGDLPIAEVDESNLLLRAYTMGMDLSGSLSGGAGGIGGVLAVSDVQGNVTNDTFTFGDGRGNVTDAIAPDDSVAATYRYDPFGNVVSSSGPLAMSIPTRFSSKPVDTLTGFYDFGLRQYDAVLGRWISRDPVGEVGGGALYQYANNNPVRNMDPVGATVQRLPVELRDPGYESYEDDMADVIYEGEFFWDCDKTTHSWYGGPSDMYIGPNGFQVLHSNTPGRDLGRVEGWPPFYPESTESGGLAHAYMTDLAQYEQLCRAEGCPGESSGRQMEIILGVRLFRCDCEVHTWYGRTATRCMCEGLNREVLRVRCPCKKKSIP